MFMYPEHRQTDFINDFFEENSFDSQIEVMKCFFKMKEEEEEEEEEKFAC